MKRIFATVITLLSLISTADAHRLHGTATYYGGSDGFCGRRTASGPRFNCRAMTAAHRTLPFGTVLNVSSGSHSIQVTVTDRGPFTRAFLDLSPAAASALGCRCTHHNVTATIVQMGSGETIYSRRQRHQKAPVVAETPSFFLLLFGQPKLQTAAAFSSAMASAQDRPRHHRHRRHRRH